MADAKHDPFRDPETGRRRRLPTYDEESSEQIGASELRRRFSWLTEEEAAEQAARAEEDAALLVRTATDVGLDPTWPGEERERPEPEKLGEVHDGLPLWTREQRDRYLVLLMKWFGLKRFVRSVPREKWAAALREAYQPRTEDRDG
jgi:hypothetical protein